MKKLLLLLLIVLFSKNTFSQYTIIGGDSTNFETNAAFAQIDTATGNLWQIGTTSKSFFGASYSAPFSIMTDTINSYSINSLSTFTIEIYDTSGSWGSIPSARLGFWHKYETDSLKDGGYIEVSLDSGTTWQNIADPFANFMMNPSTPFYSVYDTISGNIPAFNGSLNSWTFAECHLQFQFAAIIAGEPRILDTYTQKLMVRFNFKSDNINTNKAGWIIDDLYLREYDIGGGVHDLDKINFDVQAFPNPSAGEAIIQVVPYHRERNFTIMISDIAGKKILESETDQNNQLRIQPGAMNSGLYLYTVTSESGASRSGKLIIK